MTLVGSYAMADVNSLMAVVYSPDAKAVFPRSFASAASFVRSDGSRSAWISLVFLRLRRLLGAIAALSFFLRNSLRMYWQIK